MTKRRQPRRKKNRKQDSSRSSRRLWHETLERRELLAADIDGAPRLIGVNPNAESIFSNDRLNEVNFGPTELTFRFDGGQQIDPSTIAGGIRITPAGGDNSFDGDEDPIIPGFLGFGDNQQTVIARFEHPLGDDRYRIEVFGEDDTNNGITSIKNVLQIPFKSVDGSGLQTIDFDVELGGKVIAVVPQPIAAVDGTLVRADNQIDVYFDDADLFRPGSNVANPAFYQLVDTHETATTEDDDPFTPTGVVVDTAAKKVSLQFASSLETLVGGPSTSFRLRVGNDADFETLVVTPVNLSGAGNDPGLTINSATDLTTIAAGAATDGSWTLVIDQEIENVGVTPLADNPGAYDEIGHRDIELITSGGSERHHGNAGDGDDFIEALPFTFLKNTSYGNDANGDPLFNGMNDEQEARFREILELYGDLYGLDFYETEAGGLKLIVGDLSTADPTITSGPGGVAGLGSPGGVTMDYLDFTGAGDNEVGGSFWGVALHEIGHAIDLGHSYDVEGSVQGAGGGGDNVYPSPDDIVHGEFLHQKEALDVDLYRIDISEPGTLVARALAEGLADSSLLDTRLTLFRQDGNLVEVVSANDDYFGSDSFLEVRVNVGTYFVGVSAEGNNAYDIQSGLTAAGGVSEGDYNLRLEFNPNDAADTIIDADGSALDGDRDGVAGGNYNFWFEAAIAADTIYVRKPDNAGDVGGDGSLAAPFDNIDDALAVAAGKANSIVRVVANDGPDNNVMTLADNEAYEIGFVPGVNITLDDGRNLIVPDNTSLVVDAGAILKFLDSRVSIGSDDNGVNRSGSAIQVLGTPQLPVYFTSFNDHTKGANANPNDNTPVGGDWGGIDIRNDVDRIQGRQDAERQGIFENYVNHALIEFGGGGVSTIGRVVDPVHLSQARAEISYNTITDSANNAISADPNTFEVTSFVTPRFQNASVSGDGFVTDYDRIGPDIHGNELHDNSTNALFVRIDTLPGGALEQLEVTARFDDTDIVHVLGESLLLKGQPGGPFEESVRPSPIIGLADLGSGPPDNYSYSFTFVDRLGNESLASVPQPVSVGSVNSAVQLTGIAAAGGDFVARRLYRSDNGSPFRLIAELDSATSSYLDTIQTPSAEAPILTLAASKLRARPDATLIADAGIIMKNSDSRIELGYGATFIAEGNEGSNVVMTSIHDDRFGIGGSFDTGNDGAVGVAAPGDWSGVYANRTSRVSVDHAFIAFGGGVSGLNGSTAGFNAVELHQARGRIANTRFEYNAEGGGGQSGGNRQGLSPNSSATIHVAGSQPIIVGNIFVDNGDGDTAGGVVSINVNALDSQLREDTGRQTGNIGLFDVPPGNHGPVIRGNELDGNDVNGIEIRGGTLNTEVVFDDTDIVHVVRNDIVSTNLHTFNGLRLESSDNESLVVKLTAGAGFVATGESLDITDRVGGRVQVLGTPGNPVVLTSLFDSTVGAGFTPEGDPQTQTVSTGTPGNGNWQGISLDSYSHDRNVDTTLEFESDIGGSGDTNATIGAHQYLGQLAPDEYSGDENRRLGFTVFGAVAAGRDQDMYSFAGTAGKMVWLDIDRTDPGLDTVLEFLDGDGNVLALSENSRAESQTGALTYVNPLDVNNGDFIGLADGHALPMPLDPETSFNAQGGGNRDFYGLNDGDAGMRVVLPGSPGSVTTYYVRVRSSNPADLSIPAEITSSLEDGRTHGGYQLQIRLTEADELGGSVIRFADIRYATIGIEAIGLPAHSPLAGELSNPGGTVDLGSFENTDRGAVSVAGLADGSADSYQFTVGRDKIQNIGGPPPVVDAKVSTVIDVDWADGFTRPNLGAFLYHGDRLIAIGTDSNVLDDQASPTLTNQTTDPSELPSGSFGPKDPFIGPLELSSNGDYEVVIATNEEVPPELLQFSVTGAPNPNIRLEPLDIGVRIADDRFDIPGVPVPDPLGGPPFQGPITGPQVAFNDDASNIVPWHIGDVPLIAFRNNGDSDRVSVYNPLTGRHDAIIDSATSVPLGAVAQSERGDIIAIRDSGGAGNNDANTSTTYRVNTDGTLTSLGATGTGIGTFEYFDGNDGDPLTHFNRGANDGMEFSSLAFYNDTNSQNRFLYGLANRGTFTGSFVGADANNNDVIGGSAGPIDATNLIYRLNPDTGQAISRRGANMPGGFESANPLDGRLHDGNSVNVADFPAETPWAGTNIVAQIQIPATAGTVVELVPDLNGGTFLLAFTNTGAIWRVDFSEGAGGLYAAGDIRGNATLISPGIADVNGNIIVFQNVTAGPANYQHNDADVDIRRSYFGVGSAGGGPLSFYAFDSITGIVQPVFAYEGFSMPVDNNNTSGNFDGFFFSSLDSNLWHLSSDQAGNTGHGMPALDNNARPTIGGGTSLKFGFDPLNQGLNHIQTTPVDTSLDASDLQNFLGYNFLGGAHGVVQSNPLDLKGIASEDLPTLYFTYLLDTQSANGQYLRAYVASEDNEWSLVATNNFSTDAANLDWTSNGEHSSTVSRYGDDLLDRRFVQQLFDSNTGARPGSETQFRQARIDLGPWAGQENVKIRFEFSTAGEARPDQAEIHAIAGFDIADGHTITISGPMPIGVNTGGALVPNSRTFEFDSAGNGTTTPGAIQISVNPADTVQDVRDKIQRALADEIHFDDAVGPVFSTNMFPIAGDAVRLYDLQVSQTTTGRPLQLVLGDFLAPNGADPNLPASQFGSYAALGFGGQASFGQLVAAGNRSRGNGGGNGVFIDDIVIGLAERGEHVGNAAQTASPIGNLANNPYFEPVYNGVVLPEVPSGSYQVEVRLAREYADPAAQFDNFMAKLPQAAVGLNERLAKSLDISVDDRGVLIADGDTFTISNGSNTLTFEFNSAGTVTAGNVAVDYQLTDSEGEVAQAIRDAINTLPVNSALEILATNQSGDLVDPRESDPVIAIHGFAAADHHGGVNFGPHLTGIINGRDIVDGEDNGDRNLHRDQGQLIIENNRVSFSSDYGILVDAGTTAPSGPFNAGTGEGNRPKPGAVQNFPTLNTTQQIPGAVIQNNLLYQNAAGGIRVSGDTTPGASSGFLRVLNNTVYGDSGGFGIRIDDNASPALLNNVVMNNNTGISVNNAGEVLIRGTVYQGNAAPTGGIGVGTEANVNPVQQLFVNANPAGFDFAAGNPNFYPELGSPVVDSSVPGQNDRTLLLSVKDEVGLPPSPIIVPRHDLLGQTRGQQFFADRGATERLDDRGPTALLQLPLDNDANGFDVDPRATVVQLASGRLDRFEIILDDAGGTGPDASTISADQISILENGRLLTPGEDFIIGYNTSSQLLRLTPTSGQWRPDAVYVITLNNRNSRQIDAQHGQAIADGDQLILTDDQGNRSVFEYETGNAIEVPTTLSIRVLGANNAFVDGEQFDITAPDGTTTRRFEINTTGTVSGGNVPIDLQSAGTAAEVRQAIFNAIQTLETTLDLALVNVADDVIQLGSLAGHTITPVTAATITGLEIFGIDAGIEEGQQFSYQNATGTPVVFQFTSTPTLPEDIPFSRTDTADEIAAAIATVVATQPLGLTTARAVGDGVVSLGGAVGDIFSPDTSTLTQIGTVGVTGAITLEVPLTTVITDLLDETFTVTVGTNTQVFQFTDSPTLPVVGNRVLLSVDDPNEIALAVEAAIAAAFPSGLSPSTQGNIVTLGEQPAIIPDGTAQVLASVDVSGTDLIDDGISGGAITIDYFPTCQFTAQTSAEALANAIRMSPLEVEVTRPGGGAVLLSGIASALSVTSSGTTPLGTNVNAIADLAGNPLLPNQNNGETRFTIIMPDVVLDYGDAPDSYRTLIASNGARHAVVVGAVGLGALIDAEDDAQVDPDSDDAPLVVTASGDALFLIDASVANTVSITVGSGAVGGETLTLNVDGNPITFELVSSTSSPAPGNITVPINPGDTAEQVANSLFETVLGTVEETRDTLNLSIDGTNQAKLNFVSIDDEDGVPVGTFDNSVDPIVAGLFLSESALPTASDPVDVVAYLNRNDPGGAVIPVTVRGAGLLDVWVDLNRDGDFDEDGEHVLSAIPVLDGLNPVRLITPPTATQGLTWARFRVSSGGVDTPDGIANDGEVEDYQVQIFDIDQPIVGDDVYAVDEDDVLLVDGINGELTLFDNDTVPGPPAEPFVDSQYVVQAPRLTADTYQLDHGILRVIDPSEGTFEYTPDPDYYGPDSFVYSVTTQRNDGLGTAPTGLVTINVNPINDPPTAVDQFRVGTEDTLQVFTAAELLAGASSTTNPAILTPPQDESNQALRIISVSALGVTIDANSVPGTSVTTLLGGTVTATFDTNGDLIDVSYLPRENFNRDNLPLANGDPRLDVFQFTIEDDGISILPGGTPVQGTPLTSTANVRVEVTPQNDDPFLRGDYALSTSARYMNYFTTRGLPIPVPTEDTSVVIPAQFLLENDLAGPLTAVDEGRFVNNNDGPLQIISVAMVDPSEGSIVILPSGDIEFTPAANLYDVIRFTYTAQDVGVDEAADHTRVINPLTSTVTSSIFIEPVNDAPVAYNRNLVVDEVAEPAPPAALLFTADDLLNGAGANTSSPIGIAGTTITLPNGATMIDGETMSITDSNGLQLIVEFSTSATPAPGTDVLVNYTVLQSGFTIASNFQDALRAIGSGGTAVGNTVSFPGVSSVTSNPVSSTLVADAASVTIEDGNTLIGGESVTVVDGDGNSVVFEFSTAGASVRGADVVLPFTTADSAAAIATSFRDALIANGFGATAVAGIGTEWIVQFVSTQSFTVDDPLSLITTAGNTFTLPDGGDLIFGETITIDDGSGANKVVEFNTTGTPAPGTDFVVLYNTTQTGDLIAATFANVLRAQGFGVTANGADVTLSAVASATAAAPATFIVATPQGITVPNGLALIDGETIDLGLVGGGTLTVEFNTTGTPAFGTDLVIPYSTLDLANTVATRLEAALRGVGLAATANGDVVELSNTTAVFVGEIPSVPGAFPENLAAPFNESEQALRVVSITTTAGTVDFETSGDGLFDLATSEGGLLRLRVTGGLFVNGTYLPPVDYNERTPFAPNDMFTFLIADDGMTTLASSGAVRDLPDEVSVREATATLTVTETNDPPIFQTPAVVNVLEDSFGVTTPNVVRNLLPGPLTAQDEILAQTVPPPVVIDLSVPAGLMLQTPVVTPLGGLTVFPAPDAIGIATYIIRATDNDPLDPRSTDATITVNVRPVNDAPRFDPTVAGTSDTNGPDDEYAVANVVDGSGTITDATITYTLKEDNTQAGGALAPYFIPLNRSAPIGGYSRVGLLDVFVAGPDNELDGSAGGLQTLELFSFPALTDFGGQLSPEFQAGQIVGLNYVPPLDFNNVIGAFDEFSYTVRDDSPGGETFSLAAGALVPNRLTSVNRVRLDLNPVNDQPLFTAATTYVEAPEDSETLTIPSFAFGITPAPPTTAFDEVDINFGQTIFFDVLPLSFTPAQTSLFFDEAPTVTDQGTLSFKPAPNVFGEFDFEVTLIDTGDDDVGRGDLNKSDPVTLTIDIQPINDPPVIIPGSPSLQFSLLEDGTVDILVIGDTLTLGLLDVYSPGPANETEDIDPGGNQSLFLTNPIPASTAEGGTLTPVSGANGISRFTYRPRPNFVGMDSFIYTVTDDGATVDVGTNGISRLDARIASNTVSLQVLPVNDAPQFSGAGNLISDEDQGLVTVTNWATNVQAGPASATDEAAAQNLRFEITQISENTELFAQAPTAVIMEGNVAELSYLTAPDANGIATLTVRLIDDGPTNLAIGDLNVSPSQTFTIRVNAINDPPSFVPGSTVTVDEDSGPYNQVWATNVSPGPIDEATQSVRFEAIIPVGLEGLFQTPPVISDSGVLRFTPALNANGTVDVVVRAIDSEGGQTPDSTLRIVINEVNDPPVAVSDTIDTDEDTVLTILPTRLTGNDIDPDLATNPAEVLTVVIPQETFSISGARVSLINGDIVYDPTGSTTLQSLAPGQTIVDSFSYSIRDTAGVVSAPVTVSLNVDGINDAPVAGPDNPSLNPNGPTIIPVLNNDSDVDGTIVPTSLVITLQPAFGALDLDTNGVVTYTPFRAFAEEDQFSYTVADNLGLRSAETLVTISANAAPIARDDFDGTFLNEAVDVNVAANDTDPDGQLDLASVVIVSQGARGEAIPQADGTVRYLPDPGFIGTDSFKYVISDTEGRTSEFATATVRVVASRLQNPDEFTDVNDDGKVTAIDALLVLNHIGRSGMTSIPVDINDRGPNFYDVSGNQLITALDALQVINELSLRDALGFSAEAEQIVAPAASTNGDAVATALPELEAVQSVEAKIVDASVADIVDAEVVELIAGERDSESDESNVDAVDVAFAQLL